MNRFLNNIVIFSCIFTISCLRENNNKNNLSNNDYLVKTIKDTSENAIYYYEYDNLYNVTNVNIYSINENKLLYKYKYTYIQNKISTIEEFEYIYNPTRTIYWELDTFIYSGNNINSIKSYETYPVRKYNYLEVFNYDNPNQYFFQFYDFRPNPSGNIDSSVYVYNTNGSLNYNIAYEFPNHNRNIIYTYKDILYYQNDYCLNFGDLHFDKNPAYVYRGFATPNIFIFNHKVPSKIEHIHNNILDETIDIQFELNSDNLISKLKVRTNRLIPSNIVENVTYEISYIHK